MSVRVGAPAAIVLLLLAVVLASVSAQYQPLTPPDRDGLEVRTDLAEAGDTVGAQRVLRFVHVSDAHVLDDDAPEPLRVAPYDDLFYGASVSDGAWRPQEEYTDEVLDAAIRAINQRHAQDAFDFVINTGDNVDNELENELMRFLDNWEGTTTTVGPYSGFECLPDGQSENVDDDANDVADQCTSLPAAVAGNNTPLAAGLPWFSAFGNHDGLIQGNVPNEPRFQDIAAESGRYFLSQREYVGMHFAAGGGCVADAPAGSVVDDNGHGYGYAGDRLCDDDPDNDGYYAFTLRGVRFVVLDTVNDDFAAGNDNLAGTFTPETTLGNDIVGGYSEGSVDAAQFAWLMDQVESHADKLVVVMSHHTVNSMFTSKAEGNCEGGQCLDDLLTEAGYKTGPDLIEALSEHPNVVTWFGGHTHQHKVEPKSVEGAPSPGFWNVETSSLIDLPQEARVAELWLTADGQKAFWTLTPFGHDFQPSKDLAATDDQFDAETAAGEVGDQDVLLWFDVPDGVVVEPQPSLERSLRVRLVAPDPVGGYHGEPDQNLTLAFEVTDPLLDAPAAGLVADATVRHLGEDGASTVVDADDILAEAAAGRYELRFRPTVGGTHFVDLHFEDPAGVYDDLDRTTTFRVREEPADTLLRDDEESPGLGVLALLAALGVATTALRRR